MLKFTSRTNNCIKFQHFVSKFQSRTRWKRGGESFVYACRSWKNRMQRRWRHPLTSGWNQRVHFGAWMKFQKVMKIELHPHVHHFDADLIHFDADFMDWLFSIVVKVFVDGCNVGGQDRLQELEDDGQLSYMLWRTACPNCFSGWR